MPWTTPSRIAVIGYGAITDEIVRCLELRGQLEALACVLVRPGKRNELAQKAGGRFSVVDALPDLLACKPQIVIEAAGHGAVADFGAAILESGCDLLPVPHCSLCICKDLNPDPQAAECYCRTGP